MIDQFEVLLEKTVVDGGIDFDTALELTDIDDEDIFELAEVANNIRRHFRGDKVDLCSIVNARSGRCQEDCRFCSQSDHYSCDINTSDMITSKEILAKARRAQELGADRFCIVTSGDLLSKDDLKVVIEAVSRMREETSLKRCASLGRLDHDQVTSLVEAGLNRYHHNIETSRSFYPKICTTHNYDDRLITIKLIKDAGIECCVGGILNLGESTEQRIEFAFELKEVGPDSVPLNFLDPRQGTPLYGRPPMEALEAVKFIAIFRLVMPTTIIRLAAGRCETLGKYQKLGLSAGVDGLLIGDYLTTKGPDLKRDIEALASIGFKVE